MTEATFVRYIYHPIVTRLAHFLSKTGFTPIQVSLIGFVLALISAWLFASEYYAGLFFGAILTYLSVATHRASMEIRRFHQKKNSENLQDSDDPSSKKPSRFERLHRSLTLYSEILLLAGLCAHSVVDSSRILCLIITVLAVAGILLLEWIKDRPTGDFWKHCVFIQSHPLRVFILIIGAFINIPLLAILIIAILTNGILISAAFQKDNHS